MSNHVTITGRLGQDIELRFTNGGKAVANFAVADTPRRLNRDTQQWEDAGETLWLRCSLWGAKAEALNETARKGDLVIATGRLEARSWDDKETGAKRTVIEMSAQEVAVVPRTTAKPQGGAWGGGQAQAPAADSWATSAPAASTQGGGEWVGTSNGQDLPPF